MDERQIPDIEPNTHEYREKKAEEKKNRMKPVIDANAMAKPESEFRKKARQVKRTFIREILIPGIKDGIMDFLGVAFYNDARKNRNRYGGGSYYNYGGSYRSSSNRDYRSYDRRDDYYPKNKKMDYRNIVLNERRDAEEICANLRGRIEQTGQASLGDLYDLIDVSSDFTDDNWGWTDPRDIGVRKVSNGWLIDIAEVRPL